MEIAAERAGAPLVSIVVPVYNVERYIEKCVKSIINQDYKNIEIILVDDGSPDKSGQLLDGLAAQDNRIKVVHQENKGVSAARNAGLRSALGDYVAFVDGDDWIDAGCISYFVGILSQTGADIAVNKNFYRVFGTKSGDAVKVEDAGKVIEWIYSGEVDVAVWNKLYKRDILAKNSVWFNEEIWYGEGMLFNIAYLQFAKSASVGEKAVYHQTFNPDSATRKFNLQSNLCGIRSLELQREIIERNAMQCNTCRVGLPQVSL